MELINLSPKLPQNDTNCQFLVVPIGFDAALIERIKGIFKLSQQTNRAYRIGSTDTTDRIDILLVNHDNPMSLHKKDALLRNQCPQALVVTLSQGPLANPPTYHIRGMLTASRLLSVFDKLPLQNNATLAPKPQANANSVIPHAFAESAPKPPTPVFNSQITPITPPAAVAAIDETSNYRALVVDDSLAIQLSIKFKLENIKQITTIDFADNGESALEKCTTTQYDLIFLDVMMPGIDGYETCSRLRKRPEYKKTPIIMVSGKTSPLDEVKGVMAGCTTYLSKPVNDQAFHKLSLRVLNWLADRKMITTAK